MSFTAITLCDASQQVVVVVYFVTDPVQNFCIHPHTSVNIYCFGLHFIINKFPHKGNGKVVPVLLAEHHVMKGY
jgi:hypothetical protein